VSAFRRTSTDSLDWRGARDVISLFVAHSSDRRGVLKTALGLGFGLMLPSALASAQDDRASARPQTGDLLVKANDPAKQPLTTADVAIGAPLTAWAMEPADQVVRSGSRFNQLLLLRMPPERLAPETRARSADGILAYTVICTHSGCDVDDWLADQQMLSCSCHASVFDPKDGGKVTDGPAPRALPALPLKVVDGRLTVAGPFTARIGFEPGA